MFPPNSTPSECRLPSNLSFTGGSNQPHDTSQGELDYDPFGFDVGCLGVLFCEEFQHLTYLVPMLAPLLDRMITRDIRFRFTASEAVEFLKNLYSSLSPEDMQASPLQLPLSESHITYENFDRWRSLPENFVKDWAHYREHRPSRWIRFVRRICRSPGGYIAVQWMRRGLRLGGELLLACRC